jgi:hypothetical protein
VRIRGQLVLGDGSNAFRIIDYSLGIGAAWRIALNRAERIGRVGEGRRGLDLGRKVWQWTVEISGVKPDIAETRVDSPYTSVEVYSEEGILDITELARLIGTVLRLARRATDVIRTRRIAEGLRRIVWRQVVIVKGCGREVRVGQPQLVVGIS